MVRKPKPAPHGGARKGAGLKSYLVKPRNVLLILEQKHVNWLDQYKRKQKLASRSAVVRKIVDTLRGRKTI